MSNAKDLHSQAEQTREQGNLIEALTLTDRAMVAYAEEDNLAGFAEIQASRALALRHLFEATENSAYLTLAKHHTQAAVELAQETGEPSASVMPHFNLAKVQEMLGAFGEAIGNYKAAIAGMESNPPAQHDRPAVLADMKIHLGICELKNGDESARERVETAIAELESTEELKYNKDVWLSGAHMKLVEASFQTDADYAKQHLEAAKEIIDANPDLELRAKQWQKLAESLK